MEKEKRGSRTIHFHQGDIIDLDLDPRIGHEQSGCRPALIISRDLFYTNSGLLVICPITNTNRKSPFHIPLSGSSKTDGFILCDQIRTIDPDARNVRFRDRISRELLFEVSDIITGIVDVS